MSTTYHIIADDQPIGTVDTLTLSSNDILVVTVASETTDKDLARVRQEVRSFFKERTAWREQPVIVVRAGEIRFQRVVRDTGAVSTEGAAWAMECSCIGQGIGQHDPHCPASPEYKARHTVARPEQE